jgi:hypothetical protein
MRALNAKGKLVELIDYGLNGWFRFEHEGSAYIYFRRLDSIDNPVALVKVSSEAFDLLQNIKQPFSYLPKMYMGAPKRLDSIQEKGKLFEAAQSKVKVLVTSPEYIENLGLSPIDSNQQLIEKSFLSHDQKILFELSPVSKLDIRWCEPVQYNILCIAEHYFPGFVLSNHIKLSSGAKYLSVSYFDHEESYVTKYETEIDLENFTYLNKKHQKVGF